MRTVLANGCFDLLHPGHVAHLESAKLMGDRLLVGLTLDEHVGKPGRPVQPWEERAAMLRALSCVDGVFPCKDGVDAIYQAMPNVFVKGSDYEKLTADEYEACAFFKTIVRFTRTKKQSTTDLIERIKCSA